MTSLTFNHLFRGISREQFLEEYFDRKPYYEAGAVSDIGALFSWERMNDLLDRPKLWDGNTIEMALDGRVIPSANYCRQGHNRQGQAGLRPDRSKVTALLHKGATFVLDFLEGVDPNVGAIARSFERLTGANTSCNAYCSWKAVRGYASHFDCMDVFALQIEGEKRWNLYEGRFPEATFVPGSQPSDFTAEQHDKMKGRLIQQITTRPGDILYLPRGVYHDALATDTASLHLSFGATPAVGVAILEMLAREMQGQEYFRKRLPHFEDREALAAYLSGIGQTVTKVLADPAFHEFVTAFLKERTFDKVAGYRFPERDSDGYFCVTRHTPTVEPGAAALTVTHKGQSFDLAADDAAMLGWILDREDFWLSELSEAHGQRGDAGRQLIQTLIERRVIFPIQV
jgi:ribosomal protein L16 Arg81 hydroxylase